MQYSEFETQIERLRGVYSGSSLNPERIKIWWNRFKTEKASTFESAISHVVAESTTHALPAMSKVAESCGFFRTSVGYSGASAMRDIPLAHDCPPCRDHGFGFVGDTVVACCCAMGRSLSPGELAKHQKSYDSGRAKFPNIASLRQAFGIDQGGA